MLITHGPMDQVTQTTVVTCEKRGDQACRWEFAPAREYDVAAQELRAARIALAIAGAESELVAILSPQEARALSTALLAWAAACDAEQPTDPMPIPPSLAHHTIAGGEVEESAQ